MCASDASRLRRIFRPGGALDGARHDMGDTTDGADIGIGPALALIDATLDGKPEQVYLLHDVFGSEVLARSLALLGPRLIAFRGDFGDELVAELGQLHLDRWDCYDDIVIRRRDRFRWASPAIRVARAHALRTLRHYMNVAMAGIEQPPARRLNSFTTGTSVEYTFGLAYASALSVVHIAATTGNEPDDVLSELRATIIQEVLTPPEVQPPA